MWNGHTRISTGDQTLGLQKDAIASAGCGQIYTDVLSGTKVARPGLDESHAYVRPGDTLAVWRLDRLGRSLQLLIETVTALERRVVAFRSLTASIDTTTSGGKLVIHVFGALAEFERDLIRERTTAGLASARARGRGRPKKLNTKTLAFAKRFHDKQIDIVTICWTLRISKTTLYRARKEV